MTTRVVDSKGRIALGSRFVGRTVIVDDSATDRIVVTPAVVIPEREARLYRNEKALTSVRQGWAEARRRRLSKKSPDRRADAASIAEFDG